MGECSWCWIWLFLLPPSTDSNQWTLTPGWEYDLRMWWAEGEIKKPTLEEGEEGTTSLCSGKLLKAKITRALGPAPYTCLSAGSYFLHLLKLFGLRGLCFLITEGSLLQMALLSIGVLEIQLCRALKLNERMFDTARYVQSIWTCKEVWQFIKLFYYLV